MLSTVLYYELAMKVPNPVGITVYLLTWGLGHLRCLVIYEAGDVSVGKSSASKMVDYTATSGHYITHHRRVDLVCVGGGGTLLTVIVGGGHYPDCDWGGGHSPDCDCKARSN